MLLEYCYLMFAMKYVVIAFYKFFPIKEPLALKDALKRQCKASGIVGTIIMSNEGINGTVCGKEVSTNIFIKLIKKLLDSHDLNIKESYSFKKSFKKLWLRN